MRAYTTPLRDRLPGSSESIQYISTGRRAPGFKQRIMSPRHSYVAEVRTLKSFAAGWAGRAWCGGQSFGCAAVIFILVPQRRAFQLKHF